MNSCDKKTDIIKDALKITKSINKHLTEPHCRHTIKDLVIEAFGYDDHQNN